MGATATRKARTRQRMSMDRVESAPSYSAPAQALKGRSRWPTTGGGPSNRLKRGASGDFDHRAVNVARLVGREPGIGVRDLFRLAQPAERDLVFHHLHDLAGHR